MSQVPTQVQGESQAVKAEADPAYVNIKVKQQDGAITHFRIKRSTQLKKLIDSFCVRQSIDPRAVRFLFEGSALRPEATPEDLGMEDDDEIDAMLTQVFQRANSSPLEAACDANASA